MLAVIYSFTVKPGFENELIESWSTITKMALEYAGSLGSRLHKAGDDLYIAYAYWPDEAHWLAMADKLPADAKVYGRQMQEACAEIKTLYKLDTVVDLLKPL